MAFPDVARPVPKRKSHLLVRSHLDNIFRVHWLSLFSIVAITLVAAHGNIRRREDLRSLRVQNCCI